MPVGTAHSNPLLDSWKYEIEYVDGPVEELTVNPIGSPGRQRRATIDAAVRNH
jgi:hypothetical protein